MQVLVHTLTVVINMPESLKIKHECGQACTRVHVRTHVGCRHQTKDMQTKAETHRALMMTGVIVKASGGFAPGSTSHVQWDQLEYINIGNTDVKKQNIAAS